MRRVGWRRVAALGAAATVVLGLAGTFSYGNAYWQHRGFARVAPLSGARSGRLLTVRFYSAALHRRGDYLVYLPPGYSRARRYPVYYLLHGAPGSPQDFISVVSLDVQLSNRLSEHQLRPMILVMPDGRIKGNTFSDSEWANTPAGNVESYVLDVVRNVDRRFAAIPSRAARVIAGYSMGGYGALNIAWAGVVAVCLGCVVRGGAQSPPERRTGRSRSRRRRVDRGSAAGLSGGGAAPGAWTVARSSRALAAA